jgi:hypothetical protein
VQVTSATPDHGTSPTHTSSLGAVRCHQTKSPGAELFSPSSSPGWIGIFVASPSELQNTRDDSKIMPTTVQVAIRLVLTQNEIVHPNATGVQFRIIMGQGSGSA